MSQALPTSTVSSRDYRHYYRVAALELLLLQQGYGSCTVNMGDNPDRLQQLQRYVEDFQQRQGLLVDAMNLTDSFWSRLCIPLKPGYEGAAVLALRYLVAAATQPSRAPLWDAAQVDAHKCSAKFDATLSDQVSRAAVAPLDKLTTLGLQAGQWRAVFLLPEARSAAGCVGRAFTARTFSMIWVFVWIFLVASFIISHDSSWELCLPQPTTKIQQVLDFLRKVLVPASMIACHSLAVVGIWSFEQDLVSLVTAAFLLAGGAMVAIHLGGGRNSALSPSLRFFEIVGFLLMNAAGYCLLVSAPRMCDLWFAAVLAVLAALWCIWTSYAAASPERLRSAALLALCLAAVVLPTLLALGMVLVTPNGVWFMATVPSILFGLSLISELLIGSFVNLACGHSDETLWMLAALFRFNFELVRFGSELGCILLGFQADYGYAPLMASMVQTVCLDVGKTYVRSLVKGPLLHQNANQEPRHSITSNDSSDQPPFAFADIRHRRQEEFPWAYCSTTFMFPMEVGLMGGHLLQLLFLGIPIGVSAVTWWGGLGIIFASILGREVMTGRRLWRRTLCPDLPWGKLPLHLAALLMGAGMALGIFTQVGFLWLLYAHHWALCFVSNPVSTDGVDQSVDGDSLSGWVMALVLLLLLLVHLDSFITWTRWIGQVRENKEQGVQAFVADEEPTDLEASRRKSNFAKPVQSDRRNGGSTDSDDVRVPKLQIPQLKPLQESLPGAVDGVEEDSAATAAVSGGELECEPSCGSIAEPQPDFVRQTTDPFSDASSASQSPRLWRSEPQLEKVIWPTLPEKDHDECLSELLRAAAAEPEEPQAPPSVDPDPDKFLDDILQEVQVNTQCQAEKPPWGATLDPAAVFPKAMFVEEDFQDASSCSDDKELNELLGLCSEHVAPPVPQLPMESQLLRQCASAPASDILSFGSGNDFPDLIEDQLGLLEVDCLVGDAADAEVERRKLAEIAERKALQLRNEKEAAEAAAFVAAEQKSKLQEAAEKAAAERAALEEQLRQAAERERLAVEAAEKAARDAAEQAAKKAAEEAAREAAEQAAREAAEEAAREAAEQAAREAAERAAKEAAEKAAREAAERAAAEQAAREAAAREVARKEACAQAVQNALALRSREELEKCLELYTEKDVEKGLLEEVTHLLHELDEEERLAAAVAALQAACQLRDMEEIELAMNRAQVAGAVEEELIEAAVLLQQLRLEEERRAQARKKLKAALKRSATKGSSQNLAPSDDNLESIRLNIEGLSTALAEAVEASVAAEDLEEAQGKLGRLRWLYEHTAMTGFHAALAEKDAEKAHDCLEKALSAGIDGIEDSEELLWAKQALEELEASLEIAHRKEQALAEHMERCRQSILQAQQAEDSLEVELLLGDHSPLVALCQAVEETAKDQFVRTSVIAEAEAAAAADLAALKEILAAKRLEEKQEAEERLHQDMQSARDATSPTQTVLQNLEAAIFRARNFQADTGPAERLLDELRAEHERLTRQVAESLDDALKVADAVAIDLGLQHCKRLELAEFHEHSLKRVRTVVSQKIAQAHREIDKETRLQVVGKLEALVGVLRLHGDKQLRQFHNELQDLKGALRVFCRVRPMNGRERSRGDTTAVEIVDPFTLKVQKKTVDDQVFSYDAIFGPSSSQEEVFAECKSLVQSVMDGYNVTVFTYGQTGAGKTWTLYGSSQEPGISPRLCQEIFEVIARDRGKMGFEVKSSMVELYLSDLRDLLSRAKEPPKLEFKSQRLADGSLGFRLDGLTEIRVASVQELSQVVTVGLGNRKVRATQMNADSSRSHLLLTIEIHVTDKETGRSRCGKITIVDLAGSERLAKSGVTGEAQKEAIEINKSLTALGDVMMAFTSKAKVIPYRNHKLTQLMQDSLGGTAKTLMFVNISPSSSNADESLSSLKYAARARCIENDVQVHPAKKD